MGISKAELKEKTVREAILNLLAYFAVWGIGINFDKLFKLLEVKTGELMVKKQLSLLIKAGKIKEIEGQYTIIGQKYPLEDFRKSLQRRLLKKAKVWGVVMGLLPFVKSIAVVSSVAIGNVHEESDIDLIIVTSPNRAFITKGLLMYILKMFGQIRDQYNSAGRLCLSTFITTKSIKMEKDIMRTNDPHLVYFMAAAKPIYGPNIWWNLVKNDDYLRFRLPNYIWPKNDNRIYGNGLKILDIIDDIGYRRHLKHTANQPKSHHPDAFIRIRPDIINLHHKDATTKIAEKWLKIRTSI